jgi:hypothetical protein
MRHLPAVKMLVKWIELPLALAAALGFSPFSVLLVICVLLISSLLGLTAWLYVGALRTDDL